jgi:hypothetical protein
MSESMSNSKPATMPRPSIGTRSADAAANLVMALLALIITTVSGYTTYKGMIRVVGADAPAQGLESWLPTVVALSITAVVQVGLTILCWVMGRDFARAITRKLHERRDKASTTASLGKAVSMLMLLAICFAVSVFFSFNTYFNSMYAGKEERRVEARAVPAVALEVSTLLNDAVGERRAATVDDLREMAVNSGYFGELGTISATVTQAGGRLQQAIEQMKAEQLEAEKQRVAEQFDKRARVDMTQRAIDAATARIEAIAAEIAQAETQIAERTAQIALLREEEQKQRAEAEKQLTGEAERPAGAGRIYYSAMAAARAAAGEAATLETAIQADRTRIEELRAESLEVEKSIGIARVEIEAEAPAEGNGGDENRLPVSGAADIQLAVDALEKARIAFEQNPLRPAYDALQGECEKVRTIGSADEEARAALEGTACKARSDAFDSAVDAFTVEEARRAEYITACTALGNGGLAVTNAIATLRQCHFLAIAAGVDADGRKATKAFEAVEDFAAKFDKEQHPFLKTLRAFSIAPNLAALALFFASIQDVAVFIMTFMVEFFRREREFARMEQRNSQLGEDEIEAIRYILSRADPVPGRKDAYAFRLTPERVSTMSTDAILAIKGVIEDLRSRGMITALNRSSYVITNTGFVTMNNRLRNSPLGRGVDEGARTTAPRQGSSQTAQPGDAAENVLAISSRMKMS